MGQFFLVTGTGKTGTTWLSEALNPPTVGIICFDEWKLGKPTRLQDLLSRNRNVKRIWGKLSNDYSWIKSISSTVLGHDRWRHAAEYEIEHGVGSAYYKYFEFIE